MLKNSQGKKGNSHEARNMQKKKPADGLSKEEGET